MEIPVYVFTGFLEAGKTKFIQETLEDVRFNSGEKTLVLLCEEGIEEIDVSVCSGKNVYIEFIETKDHLNQSYLRSLQKKWSPERVIVEYNGMWVLQDLYSSLPNNWIPAQEMCFVDSTSILAYNTNLRSLVVDKFSNCEVVIFNRVTNNTDKDALHKLVRGLNRRGSIAYEYTDGSVEHDEIEDPLPFDINANIINIEDRDYALWYRDIMEEMEKYNGKVVSFKAIVADNKKFDSNVFVAGRHVMTCCVDDIAYCGMLCELQDDSINKPKTEDWVIIEAMLSVEYHKIYKQKGPVLKIRSISPANPPEQKVATFY